MSGRTETTLEPKLVGDIEGRFLVPAYQRGYRWGDVEVRRLLDDIWASEDRTYYLQPIVVKRRGGEWELVDGQQRLTTLFLIFRYLVREGLKREGAQYSIRYETRPDSEIYLAEPDEATSQDSIDFFHIHQAYKCIREWFDAHGGRLQRAADKVYGALFDHVKVIWYQVPDDQDAITLFTRLNVGRIPLDDSELVKALLLSTARRQRGDDRATEIAAQWDAIERELRNPELWSFITGSHEGGPTRISMVLDSLADGPSGRDRPPFHTFESLRGRITADYQQFWEDVVDRHALVVGWYDNRDLFHKIGYLVAQGTPFADLVQLANGTVKSRFEAELDDLIRRRLMLTDAQLRDLTYGNSQAARALLLMNVETVRRRTHSTERYSFREHASGAWSLEHIHAQNAEPLTREEQWATWLASHRDALADLPGSDPDVQALINRIDEVLTNKPVKGPAFRALEQEVTGLLSPVGEPVEWDMHSIANLALLHGGDNAALSNSVFAVKRAEVLRLDREGSYVPVCTRNVFLKYYSPPGEQQMHFWGAADRQHYLREMVAVLTPYLTHEEATP